MRASIQVKRRWAPVALVMAGGLALAPTACSEDDSDPQQTTTTADGGSGGMGGAGGSGGEGLPDGEPCSEGNDCASGHCTDGVCCNGACTNPCRACDTPAAVGSCTLHEPATDPESECGGGSCDGTGACADGSHLWSQGFGSSAEIQMPVQIAADSLGNLLLLGTFAGTINFGGSGDELTSAGGTDVFLAKLTPDGTHLWSQRFGDGADQTGAGLSLGVTNTFAIAGAFEGTINFGGSGDELTSAGGTDVFLARFDADGNHVGSAAFGDDQPQAADALRITDCGDIVVLGRFQGAVTFGGPSDTLTAPGDEDVFIARFLPDGTYLWSKHWGDPAAAEAGRALGSDAEGNVVAAGHFAGNLDLGGDTLTSTGGADLFVVKLAADGTHRWSRSFGDGADQWAGDVVVDSEFNVVLLGAFDGNLTFGAPGDALTSQGGYDLFLGKLDMNGDHIWSRSFGDSTDQGADHHHLAVDWKSNLVMVGALFGTVDFAGTPLTSAGLEDVYLTKLAADGTPLWSQRFGDAAAQLGTSVTLDPERNITIVGTYEGSPDFGDGALPSQASAGTFVARFAP